MKSLALRVSTCLLIAMSCVRLYSQDQTATTDLVEKLKGLTGVKSVTPGRGGADGPVYDITFEQPVDHTKPDGAKFEQRVYLSHVDFSQPMLLHTEGYSSRGVPGRGELHSMLGGNQVAVEHRYFGRSVPDPLQWEYLTVKNAADDMHAIVSQLKKLYKGKWVSTGASKGGQTSLFFKCYYPDDVDVTVAYVAPVNVTQEDPRIYEFLKTTGDEATRQKIKDFQITLLKHEDEILPIVEADAKKKNWTFGMSIGKAYEYGVLEYPYAFWQYGTKIADVPAADAKPDALAEHYIKVGTLRYYSDQGKKQFEPFLYQAFTEIGYYNYDTTDFKQYMKSLPNPTNLDICPDGTKDKIVFNPATMYFVYNTLQYKASNVIYIYGDLDAWAATQMQLIGRTNAIKFVVKDAHHGARIGAFSPEQKELFYTTVEKWLDMKLNRQ
jgi:hypothetical protein